MTGLATGPHLDFRIERRGEFLNFERLPLPTADPVAKRDWDALASQRDRALALMPAPGPPPSLAKNNAAPAAAGAAETQPARTSSTPMVVH
jgi:murein DD-endopeptidase MepM/ murein hydrolase activator NlpD